MTQDKEFLGTEPVGRLLWKLAVPTVIAQLVNMLYNIVDRIYIGHIPGDGSLALTGVGVCLPIIMIISAFAAFVSSGGAPRASIAMGRGDYDQAQRILGGCFTLQVGISLVLTAVLLIWNRPLLLAFGASGNTIGYAVQYMQIYALGTLFVELTLGLNAFITAQGFAQVGMKTVLIGAVANILLDPLFIFALDMGVRGAALATVLSQGISCVWVISFLRGKKTLLRLEKASLPIRRRLILPCVALGTATFIMQASESVISVCFNASLLRYGGDIAVRKWLGKRAAGKPLTGHHLGVYGQVFTYDFEWGGTGYMGGEPGGTLWDKGNYAVGVEYGYSLPVARRLNIDFTIGVGYWGGKYYTYSPLDGHDVWESTKNRHWFGPTKAEISLVWLLGRGNSNNRKGGMK